MEGDCICSLKIYYLLILLTKVIKVLCILKTSAALAVRIQCHRSGFTRVGLTIDRFVTIMSGKMFAQDEDEHIRQMFLAFDMQCMFQQIDVTTTLSLLINHSLSMAYSYI